MAEVDDFLAGLLNDERYRKPRLTERIGGVALSIMEGVARAGASNYGYTGPVQVFEEGAVDKQKLGVTVSAALVALVGVVYFKIV